MDGTLDGTLRRGDAGDVGDASKRALGGGRSGPGDGRVAAGVGLVHEILQGVVEEDGAVGGVEEEGHIVGVGGALFLGNGERLDGEAEDEIPVLLRAGGDASEDGQDLRGAILGSGARVGLLDVHEGEVANHGGSLGVDVERGEVLEGEAHRRLRLEALVDVGQDLHHLLLGRRVRGRHLVHDARHQHVEHALELGIVRESERGERLIEGGELLSLRGDRGRRHLGRLSLEGQIRHGAHRAARSLTTDRRGRTTGPPATIARGSASLDRPVGRARSRGRVRGGGNVARARECHA